MMSFVLLLIGIAKITSGGVCCFGVGNDLVLRLGFSHLARARQRHAAREMPEHGRGLHRGSGCGIFRISFQ